MTPAVPGRNSFVATEEIFKISGKSNTNRLATIATERADMLFSASSPKSGFFSLVPYLFGNPVAFTIVAS